MKARLPWLAAAVALLVACGAGWRANPTALRAAWLAAWWCWNGIVMGALAQVWLHNLTGGRWGEPIRAPVLALGRTLWFPALLFLPLLAALPVLYPWAQHAASGPARWAGELSAPAFKSAWLQPLPFVVRSVLWLVLWNALAWLSSTARLARSQGFAAAALIGYSLTASIAAVDWIMSLMPLWYSSVFGLLVLMAQSLGGMALAILLAVRRRDKDGELLGDLGNLLLAYAMTLAYLGFMQYLVIWAENLPHEIIWYTARGTPLWRTVGWLLALLLFALPSALLLFRAVKRNPAAMAWLAWLVLAMLLVHAWWLVLPSVPVARGDAPWAAPLGALALAGVLAAYFRWRPVRWETA
ncbi:hypothetical protein [Massilia agilis]